MKRSTLRYEIKTLHVTLIRIFRGTSKPEGQLRVLECFMGMHRFIGSLAASQSMVTLSTVEAELVAATEAIKEILKVRKLLKELGLTSGPTTLFIDNQSVLRLLMDESAQKRTGHMDVKFKYLRERLDVDYTVKYIQSKKQLAGRLY